MPSSVEGFGTIAERSRRVGRTKSAIKPARMRSDERRLGVRCRERFRNYGTDSAGSEQAGQGCDEVDEKDDEMTH